MFIEEKALEQKLSVIDTVIKFCDEHKLDPQEIVPFINRNLKEKLEAEFIDARMLPAYSQLEFWLTGFKAYQLYLAIKLHFTNPKYNVFKHKGRINAPYEAFLKRNDRYLFDSLAKSYSDLDFIKYVACNFAYGYGNLLYDKSQAEANYLIYTKRRQSISQIFESDLTFLLDTGRDSPTDLLQYCLGQQITVETFSILNDLQETILQLKQLPVGLFLATDLLRLEKTKGFVKYNTERIQSLFNNYLEEKESNYHGTHVS